MKSLVHGLIATFAVPVIALSAPVGICLHAFSPEATPDKIECFEFERTEKTQSGTRYFLPNGRSVIVSDYRNRGVLMYPVAGSPDTLASLLAAYESRTKESPSTHRFLNPWIVKLRSNQAEAAKQAEKLASMPSVTLPNGTILEGCKATKIVDDMVSLTHSCGVKKVKLSDLSEATQKALKLDEVPKTVTPPPPAPEPEIAKTQAKETETAAHAASPAEDKPEEIAQNTQPTSTGQTESAPQKTEQTTPPQAPKERPEMELIDDRNDSVAIKGICLGMAGIKARDALIALGDGSITMKRFKSTSATDGFYIYFNRGLCGQISVDSEDNTVTEIYFRGRLCDFLFNSKELSAKEFAQQFIDAYNIPELKPSKFGKHDCWEGTPKRWKKPEDANTIFRVFPDKDVIIKFKPQTQFD